MRLFSKHSIHNVASYIAPQGFSVSLSHQHGRPQYYSPGSVIQGQVHLVLNSVITSPCTLRIIFACHQTIAPYPPTAAAASSTQYDTNQYPIDGHNHNHNHQSALKKSQPSSNSRGDNIFEVDHILVDNATLPPYKRQTPFHFSIKLPLCSYPPSFQDGDRSVTYSIQATLSFETQQGAPNTRSEVSSPAVEILYMPLVPAVASPLPAATAGPVASRRRSSLIIVEARAAAPREDRRKDRRKVKDSPKEDDTRTSSGLIEASIETKAGACLGECLPMVLSVKNGSRTDLHAIHLALVRKISYSHSISPTLPPSSSKIVHTATVPIAKASNAGSSWSQQLQLRIPSDRSLGLVPTTLPTITPLFKVEYFILAAIPIDAGSIGSGSSNGSGSNTGSAGSSYYSMANGSGSYSDSGISSNNNGFVGRWAPSARKRRQRSFDRSAAAFAAFYSTSPESDGFLANYSQHQQLLQQQHLHETSEHVLAAIGGVTSDATPSSAVVFSPIPVTIGSVPQDYHQHHKVKWPIPSYTDVPDRPTFVRDRFEREMLLHLSSLESLVVADDEEEEEIDIETLVQEAKRQQLQRQLQQQRQQRQQQENRRGSRHPSSLSWSSSSSATTSESDEDEEEYGYMSPPSADGDDVYHRPTMSRSYPGHADNHVTFEPMHRLSPLAPRTAAQSHLAYGAQGEDKSPPYSYYDERLSRSAVSSSATAAAYLTSPPPSPPQPSMMVLGEEAVVVGLDSPLVRNTYRRSGLGMGNLAMSADDRALARARGVRAVV